MHPLLFTAMLLSAKEFGEGILSKAQFQRYTYLLVWNQTFSSTYLSWFPFLFDFRICLYLNKLHYLQNLISQWNIKICKYFREATHMFRNFSFYRIITNIIPKMKLIKLWDTLSQVLRFESIPLSAWCPSVTLHSMHYNTSPQPHTLLRQYMYISMACSFLINTHIWCLRIDTNYAHDLLSKAQ